ncbi:MAG: response regulator, partial [Spirochaetota bacterium]|nr:response regulator [Spirochaetota bacterium]
MNKFKILVIDDEVSIHELISDAISATKYGKKIDMISAMDGEEGINCLKYQPVDFCILDLKLPKMNGLEVLKAVEESSIRCDFVMMSGHTTVEQAIEALKLGALDFFVKPVEYPELKSLVEQAYEHHQIENQKIRIKPPALSSLVG